MAWIKRNLVFVISMAAGLLLAGFCAYLLMGDLSANRQANSDYQSIVEQLKAAQSGKGAPSKESIAKAKDELTNVNQFVADVRTVFAPFPTPPKETEEGFSAYIETTIADLTLKATNAGVGLPKDFTFAFTDLRGKLKYETNNIPLWMQQWEEIKAICDILYRAKVNSLTALQRVPVNGTDLFQTTSDEIASSTVSNATTIATPYKITIRTFTRELADVVNGLTHSSNCFVIKNFVVYPAGPRNMDFSTLTTQQGDSGQADDPAPELVMPRNTTPEQADRLRRIFNQHYQAWQARQTAKEARLAAAAVSSSASGAPVTVEREQLLQVTLSVEAVKIK